MTKFREFATEAMYFCACFATLSLASMFCVVNMSTSSLMNPVEVETVSNPSDTSPTRVDYLTNVEEGNWMKPYPLGIDNPSLIKQVWGSTKWALYWKKDHIKIATFSNQFTAYDMRRSILRCIGYDA